MGAWGWLILAAAAPASPAATPRAIALEEAVTLAQRNAPQVIQAQGQIRSSAAGVRSAFAAFLPSLSVSAGATRQLPSTGGRTRVENGQIVTLPDQPWSYNVGLGVSTQLFDGGRRFFDLRQAQSRADVAEVNQMTQRYAATLAVKQQYFNVLAARETEAAASATLEQAEQQLRASIAQVRASTATRSDSLRSEIQVRNARLAVMDARTSVDVANASLTRAVGTPYTVTAVAEDSLEGASLAASDEELRGLAENGPAVEQARAALDAARAARGGAWTDYLPSVTASYSRSGNGVGSALVPSGGAFDYSGGLRLALSFPIFNQLQRESEIVDARVAVDNAEAGLRDARLGALESLAQSLGAFRSAEQRILSQSASVEAAEEDLRVQRRRYAVGGSTLLDVLTSQAQLDQARHDLIRARYDRRVAKAELEALVGRDL